MARDHFNTFLGGTDIIRYDSQKINLIFMSFNDFLMIFPSFLVKKKGGLFLQKLFMVGVKNRKFFSEVKNRKNPGKICPGSISTQVKFQADRTILVGCRSKKPVGRDWWSPPLGIT